MSFCDRRKVIETDMFWDRNFDGVNKLRHTNALNPFGFFNRIVHNSGHLRKLSLFSPDFRFSCEKIETDLFVKKICKI